MISLLRHQMIGDTTLHKLSTLSTYSFCIVRTLHNPIKTLWRVWTLHNFFAYVIKCMLYLKKVFFCVPGLGGAWSVASAGVPECYLIINKNNNSIFFCPRSTVLINPGAAIYNGYEDCGVQPRCAMSWKLVWKCVLK